MNFSCKRASAKRRAFNRARAPGSNDSNEGRSGDSLRDGLYVGTADVENVGGASLVATALLECGGGKSIAKFLDGGRKGYVVGQKAVSQPIGQGAKLDDFCVIHSFLSPTASRVLSM
jgi:hypothetical protein